MAGSVELWFRRTYRLAPTDERYLSATALDMLAEYYAYHFDKLKSEGKLEDYAEDDEFDLDEILRSAADGDWEEVSR